MASDLEGAKKFYGSIFGWSFEDGGPQTGHYNRVMLRGKQVAGMMAIGPDMKEAHSAWNVYFDTKDIDASLAKVLESGGTKFMGPHDVLDLGRMAYCADPAGAAFGFWQPGKHAGAELFGEPGAMAWHELRSRKLAPSIAFYEKVLGNPLEKMDAPMEYYTQKAGGLMHAGFMGMPEQIPGEVPSHWVVYFAVKNADETAARIKSLGGRITVEPFDSPYGRNGFAIDAWGAPFAFIQAPTK